MLNNIKKIFYRGQKVLENNLNTLYDYSDMNNNILANDLLESGILDGFAVSVVNNFIVSVESGVAYNTEGERLVLERGRHVDLSGSRPDDQQNKKIILGIKKSYQEELPVEDALGNIVPTVLTPNVEFVYGQYVDKSVFSIAEIELNSEGISNIKRRSAVASFKHPQRIVELIYAGMSDKIYPVGYQYTQYPNPSTGEFEDHTDPSYLLGGVWELRFNDRGMFFRTEGGNSSEARNESTGVQDTAVQHHKHKVEMGEHSHGIHGLRTLWGEGGGGSVGTGRAAVRTNISIANTHLGTKTASDIIEGNSTSTETRPVNMLMRIWERIA